MSEYNVVHYTGKRASVFENTYFTFFFQISKKT